MTIGNTETLRVSMNCTTASVSPKKVYTRKIANFLKIIHEQIIIMHLMKECFILNDLVSFLCGMWSRLGDQETLFIKECINQLAPNGLCGCS